MARYVAFLRALNVGGRWVKMAPLKAHFEALGARSVHTHLTSGNVIFESPARSRAALARTLEDGLEPLLGFRSEVFLRRDDEVTAIARRAAAWAARGGEGSKVHLGLLAAEPAPAAAAALAAIGNDGERFELDGAELVWTIRGGVRDSTVSLAKIERALGGRVTFRRSTMLTGLAARLAPPGA